MLTLTAEKLIIGPYFYKVYQNLTELPKVLSHLGPHGLSGQGNPSPGTREDRNKPTFCSTQVDSQEKGGEEALAVLPLTRN